LRILHTHIVAEGIAAIRFVDYARSFDAYTKTYPSRQGLKKAILKGAFYIDGEVAQTGIWLQPGQKIDWVEIEQPKTKEYRLELSVLFEDDHFAVINKPAGVLVSGNQFKTIANCIKGNLKVSTELDALAIPRPVHRLDRLTSGILLIAKTSRAQISLSNQFVEKTIKKKYRAIVKGEFPEEGIINTAIDGQSASTKYACIARYRSLQNDFISLVDLYPLTGRTHQLRIHSSEMGHPIIGDKLYTKEGEVLNGKGLFLTAVAITLSHPISGESLKFEIEQPAKFDSLIERELRRWDKFKKGEA